MSRCLLLLIGLVFLLTGCSTEKKSQSSPAPEEVIYQWAEYINNREYDKASGLELEEQTKEARDRTADMLSKSFKSFKVKSVILDKDKTRDVTIMDPDKLVYNVYFDIEFNEINYTSWEKNAFRYFVLKKMETYGELKVFIPGCDRTRKTDGRV